LFLFTQRPPSGLVSRTELAQRKGESPMKWSAKSLYARMVYTVVVLGSIIAAIAAGFKWN